jgi:gas vesicle protein
MKRNQSLTLFGATLTLGLVIAVGTMTMSCSASASPPRDTAAANANPADSETTATAMLKRDMRKLWTDHVVWTRAYVVAAVGDQPDASAAADRLMKNQEQIGSAVANYYGPSAGDQLTSLLKEHITIAVDVVKAAKANNKDALKAADDRWKQNADQIATMLSGANPNWPKSTLADLLNDHLKTTTDEVVARLKKDWNGDVQAFDHVYDHILKMADAISDGIIKQFPEKFR